MWMGHSFRLVRAREAMGVLHEHDSCVGNVGARSGGKSSSLGFSFLASRRVRAENRCVKIAEGFRCMSFTRC